ncbi:MAG: tetratricopeptide repeat protein, partial [Gemmatimonadales bacterium]
AADAASRRAAAAPPAGALARARAAARRAVASAPALAPAHFTLALLELDAGRHAEALTGFEAAAAARPDAADAWLRIGLCREHLGDLPGAADAYATTTRLTPADPTPAFNLGNVLRMLGRMPEAEAAFAAAARLAPDAIPVLRNHANVLVELGRRKEAEAALRRGLTLEPGSPDLEYQLALVLLGLGRLEEGWQRYRARWTRVGLSEGRGLPWPLWDGRQVGRLLLWREQGLGDELLFATCVADAVARAEETTLAVDKRLAALAARAFPGVRIVTDLGWGPARFDAHLPLGSLPGLFRNRLADFPFGEAALKPLLTARPDLAEGWRERLAELGPGLRVGVAWRSGLAGVERSRYYAPLEEWGPILAVPGVRFVLLQYDDCAEELARSEQATGVPIHRWPDLDLRDDLDQVAALAANLDLVITAPTAVSSITGALGVATWQLEVGTDWTLFGADRSPWFPAIEAFRRTDPAGSWTAPIGAVADRLANRAAGR